MTTKALSASIGLAAGWLALGYALSPWRAWALLFAAIGLLWYVGRRRGWDWVGSICLVSLVGGAAVGLVLGAAAGWMLLGTVAALSAWDLDHFARRLTSVKRVESERELECEYLRRLLFVAGVGLLLASIPLLVTIGLNFGVTVLLGLLAILGLGHVIAFLRRESD